MLTAQSTRAAQHAALAQRATHSCAYDSALPEGVRVGGAGRDQRCSQRMHRRVRAHAVHCSASACACSVSRAHTHAHARSCACTRTQHTQTRTAHQTHSAHARMLFPAAGVVRIPPHVALAVRRTTYCAPLWPARCPVVRSTHDAPRRTVPLTGASIALCAHWAHTYQPPRSRIGVTATEGCRTASALLSAHPGPTYPLACRAWAPHLGAVPLSFLPLSLLAPD